MSLKAQNNNFLMIITDLLSKISHQHINYFQFYMIVQEAKIKFTSVHEIQKYKKWFTQNHPVHKHMVLNVLQLDSAYTKNNQLYFYVKMPKNVYQSRHKNICCFNWWMKYMYDKYGSTIKWFQVMAGKTNTYVIKIHIFKDKINELIRNTLHEECADKICSFFPKTTKNEIQWMTFMNVIRNSKIIYRSHKSLPIERVRPATNQYFRPKTPYSRYKQTYSSNNFFQNDKTSSLNLSTSLSSQKVKLEKHDTKISIKIIKRSTKYKHLRQQNYFNTDKIQTVGSNLNQPIL